MQVGIAEGLLAESLSMPCICMFVPSRPDPSKLPGHAAVSSQTASRRMWQYVFLPVCQFSDPAALLLGPADDTAQPEPKQDDEVAETDGKCCLEQTTRLEALHQRPEVVPSAIVDDEDDVVVAHNHHNNMYIIIYI